MSVPAIAAPADERLWLKRAVLVLVRPHEVLADLRDDSDTAARARSEAVLALVLLGGIAGVIWTPVAGTVLNDVQLDWLDVLVWAFIGGGVYGAAAYFVGGLVLYALTPGGGGVPYLQGRPPRAFAGAPPLLSPPLLGPPRPPG